MANDRPAARLALPRMRVASGVIDASHTVRSGAVASARTAGLTYVDYRMPQKFWPFLAEHEQVERGKMAEGVPYLRAHTQFATPAERAMVEDLGSAWSYSWERYTREMDGELEHIEHEPGERPPPPDPHVDIDSAVGHHRGHGKT
jgi:hypothetical protein